MSNFNYMCLVCHNYVQADTPQQSQVYLRTHKNNCVLDLVTDELLQQRLQRNKERAHPKDKYVEFLIPKTRIVTNARGTFFVELPYFVKCGECKKETDCVHLGSVNDAEFLCMDCWNENYEDVYYRGEWY